VTSQAIVVASPFTSAPAPEYLTSELYESVTRHTLIRPPRPKRPRFVTPLSAA